MTDEQVGSIIKVTKTYIYDVYTMRPIDPQMHWGAAGVVAFEVAKDPFGRDVLLFKRHPSKECLEMWAENKGYITRVWGSETPFVEGLPMARGIELQFSALVVDFRDITLSKVIRVAEEKPADERDFVSVSERFIVIPQWAIEGSETGRSDQPTIVKYAFDKARNEVVLFGAASFDVCLPEGEGGRVEIEGTQIKPEDVPSAYRGFVHPSLGLPRLIAVKEARRLAS